MTEIAAKKLYVGDELVYEKPEMKFIYVAQNVSSRSGSTNIIDMSPQSPDFSSENITITVINGNNNFTKTFKTSEWLTGGPKLIGDLSTGQVIENTDFNTNYFEVYYSPSKKLNVEGKGQNSSTIIIYTI